MSGTKWGKLLKVTRAQLKNALWLFTGLANENENENEIEHLLDAAQKQENKN